MAMKSFYDSSSLFSRLIAFFVGCIERFGTNWRFILFTSEAFTSVRTTALHFFSPSHLLLMRWDDYSMSFKRAWDLMGSILSFASGDEKLRRVIVEGDVNMRAGTR